jgi:antitoxin ParD1/3/4
MNVSLTTEMEQWVQQKVGSGLYSSASEVVREALRALHANETRKSAKLANLRDAIQEGIDAAEEGGLVEWSAVLTDEIKETARKRRNA